MAAQRCTGPPVYADMFHGMPGLQRTKSTKRLRFEGYSDDLFGECNVFGETYDNGASGEPIVFRLWSPAEQRGMHVWGMYAITQSPRAAPACWAIGVQQLDEGVDVPWPVKYVRGEEDYTTALCVDAPFDVEMTCLNEPKPTPG